MNTQEFIAAADEHLMHTYNRYHIVMDHGDGVTLYDTDGKSYLDFGAGIAVFAFGYNHPYLNGALKAQIDRLVHTSNYFYNEPAGRAAGRLAELSGLSRVFFTNSGTEAVEGALKLARKYAYLKDGSNDHEIIAMERSFHGRSMGSLSVTGTKHYRDPFEPLIGGIRFAEYNHLDSVKAQINDRTCAIILETVQGEGGVYPADPEFLKGIRELCDEHGLLMILDEIQCGMGRTGKMFAWQHYGVQPDIMTLAKALGCGLPIGAFLAKEDVAAALVPGDHGTTCGGNPLSAAAANAVLDLFAQSDVTGHVTEVGNYLAGKLEELASEYDMITGHRGLGLMQGLVFREDYPLAKLVQRVIDSGLIVFTAGGNVIRFVPPLIIEKEHVDRMVQILRGCLDEM